MLDVVVVKVHQKIAKVVNKDITYKMKVVYFVKVILKNK